MSELENVNVAPPEVLVTPAALKARLPASRRVGELVRSSRHTVAEILARRDPRLLVVVGPCSIHDPEAALDYARRLMDTAQKFRSHMFIVMRTYFEKPRTTVGWKGLINDPYLDDSFQVGEGLSIARKLLLDISEIGLPVSTEALNPITPQYLHDLITWSAIGARTTESQTHRELASGLSSAVGFKNGTDGSLEVAINALESVTNPQRFLGINATGQVALIQSTGNPNAHIVLRGGSTGPNYEPASIAQCERALEQISQRANIMVDCSHGNSNKDHSRQADVARCVADQIRNGNQSLIGLMLESNLHEGNQRLSGELRYGVSITDACIDWKTTDDLLKEIAQSLKEHLPKRLPRENGNKEGQTAA